MKFKDTKLTKTIANRTLALLLSACMIGTSFGSVPLTAYASQGTDGLCDHHTLHTAECGYSEATQGHECTHAHDSSCGYQEARDCDHVCGEDCGENGAACTHNTHDDSCGYQEASSCTHTHDDACGYIEATSGSPCNYTCTKCNTNNGNDNEPKVSEGENTTDDTENDADAEDADAEDTDADDSGATCICTEACTEESFNTECPVCKDGGGEYSRSL